jgi:hypothetical protein
MSSTDAAEAPASKQDAKCYLHQFPPELRIMIFVAAAQNYLNNGRYQENPWMGTVPRYPCKFYLAHVISS